MSLAKKWDGEPGGLPSMGSHRVGHDCSDLYPTSKVRSSSGEEITHVQGKTNPGKMLGTERGDQGADRLKLQSLTTSQSDHMDHSLV